MTAAFLPPLKFLLPVGIQYKDEVWRNHSVSSAIMQHAVWPIPTQNDFLSKLNSLGSRLEYRTDFYMHKEMQHRTRYGPTEATSGIQTYDPSDKTE